MYVHLPMRSNSSVLLDEDSQRAPTTFVILHTIYHALPQIDESAEYQCARFLLWHNKLLLSKLEVDISNFANSIKCMNYIY